MAEHKLESGDVAKIKLAAYAEDRSYPCEFSLFANIMNHASIIMGRAVSGGKN